LHCNHERLFSFLKGKKDRHRRSLPTLPQQQSPSVPSEFASLSSARFQVLFHSPFGVLFIFRSHYLFAIGLLLISSLRRKLPPTLRCTPKQRDSPMALVKQQTVVSRASYGALTLSGGAFQTHLDSAHGPHRTFSCYNSHHTRCLVKDNQIARFSRWAFPASLAVTEGIIVIFFSSAY